jgi:uncharacterized protein
MERAVETEQGRALVTLDLPARARALLVLGHGAGGGPQAADLVAVTRHAVAAGIAVARVTQPYRVAGKRVPPRPPVLDAAWLTVVGELGHDGPLFLGGRSSGARVACRTANALKATAVLALAFPTHPPGRPDKDRLDELAAPDVPVLVVQGDRDAFGVPPDAPGREVALIEGAGHDLRGPAARKAADLAVPWLVALL